MYIPRSYALKMKIISKKRVANGLWRVFPHVGNYNWCMQNQEFLSEGRDVDDLNIALNGRDEIPDLTEEEEIAFRKVYKK